MIFHDIPAHLDLITTCVHVKKKKKLIKNFIIKYNNNDNVKFNTYLFINICTGGNYHFNIFIIYIGLMNFLIDKKLIIKEFRNT